ncbi:TonB-dependent receptor [Arenibacter sp. ARW7G5Y1]|uniref:TonB-dependent receptor n=1 Tax=Arenibacter sp. ARW7G5Y1 TaxID=2135619 RepID=UPI0015E89D4F|nr:TonB-dependent receptor [Arenibacter sp. ARW7G5Y1]
MKLSFLLFSLALLNAQANTYSQNKKVTVKANYESIESVLAKIESQSKFTFFYQTEEVDLSKKVSIDAVKTPINEILDFLFNDGTVVYSVVKNQIVLKSAAPTWHSSKSSSKVQSKPKVQQIIRGTVFDEQGVPLPGATVMLKGTNQGTSTDFDGNFELKIQSETSVLVVSYLGFKTNEITVGNQTQFTIKLAEDSNALQEVIVVGYGTQKKVNLTGAVSTVSSEQIEDRPVRSVGQALQGLVPNLNIDIPNGEPGGGANFNIRGITSLNGGSPLVLVDGVQMDPNIINAADIESISVLKDAAASAIYGVRAAFGVILITTKSGKKDSGVQVSLSSNFSQNKFTSMPQKMNSLDYATYMNTASINANGSPYFDDETTSHIRDYFNDPANNSPVFIHSQTSDNRYTYVGNTDWAKEIYRDAFSMAQNNIAITGGDEKTTYRASYGQLNQGGLLKHFDEKFTRNNVTLNIKSDITNWLTLSAKTTYNKQNKLAPNSGPSWMPRSYFLADSRPLMPVKHPDGNFAGQGMFTNGAAMNALGGKEENAMNDVWITGGLTLRPFEGLTINMDYTYNDYTSSHEKYVREFNDYGIDGILLGTFPHTTPNGIYANSNDSQYNAFNLWGEWVKTFGTAHEFKAMAGFNQEEKHFKGYNASRTNLINNDIPAINLATSENPIVGGYESSWAVRGAFYRLNYSYDQKYLLEVNGRYDGTSRFAKEDRFVFYPSASVGWRISEENFMSDLTAKISQLKLRYSIGTIGNQTLNNSYPYISTLNSGSLGYLIGDSRPIYLSAGGLVDSGLTWEEVTTNNIGLDFDLFNSRLSSSFDYYIRNTKNMLVAGSPLPATLGTSVPQTNGADLQVKGWELDINWRDKIGDVNYSLGFLLSDNKGKITKYDNPNAIIGTHYVGEELGEVWGFEVNGLFQTDAEATAHADQSELWGGTWAAGDTKYEDLDGDDKITRGDNTIANPGDQKVIGNTSPRYSYGLTGSAQWKGFDFNIFFQGVAKRNVDFGGWNPWFFGSGGDEWTVSQQFNQDYWRPDNTDGYFPRPYMYNYYGNTATSTRWLQNGAYIRLKQLSFGYTFPKDVMGKIGIDNFRIYFSGENLGEKSKLRYDHAFDPEVVNATTYPLQRTYSLGIDVKL